MSGSKATAVSEDPWVGTSYVCSHFGKSAVTIWRWIKRGRIPPPKKNPGGQNAWRKSVIDAY